MEKDEYEPLPLLVTIAFHQWLARLSLYFPFQRQKAFGAIYVVLAILCWLLVGAWLGLPWLGVWLPIIAFVLWKARTHRDSFRSIHPDSMPKFQFRLGQARIKRNCGYDVYLPPGNCTLCTTSRSLGDSRFLIMGLIARAMLELPLSCPIKGYWCLC